MQKVIYTCDNCEGEIHSKHVSILFNNQFSGIALPPRTKVKGDKWTVVSPTNKFLHFCGGYCMGDYFEKVLKKTKRSD